jgi:hydrogenase expression/formation protein HypC
MCLGIPGQIVAIDDVANDMATVEVGRVRRKVNIACIVDEDHPAESCLGDWVVVHVGFALSRIDEDEARLTLALFDELEQTEATISPTSPPAERG